MSVVNQIRLELQLHMADFGFRQPGQKTFSHSQGSNGTAALPANGNFALPIEGLAGRKRNASQPQA
jgi:hypothetical protein